jgi:hypothetical protein
MLTGPQAPDCYEIAANLDGVLRAADIDDYYLVGGMASGPLSEGDYELDLAERAIIAGQNTTLPVFRENGTRRDIDVLVLSTDEDRIQRAAQAVGGLIDDALEVSVFGVEPHADLMTRGSRLARLFKDFLSHRTIDEEGGHHYVLGPIDQAVSEESYEPWQLVTPGGDTFQVMHPVAQLYCYDMRSLSGPRTKDAAKVAQLRANVMENPAMARDAESMFAEWKEFITRRDALLEYGYTQEASALEGKFYSVKGRALRTLESSKAIVRIGQHPAVQKLLNFAVRTK